MILLTVGTQLPFDRFVEIVDRLAPTLPEPVFAQIGHGRYRPVNMEWSAFIGPIEFERRIEECSYILSHAGIGTIVMAQKHRKPTILFPRREAFDEHRNDHQLATVRALANRAGVSVALDEAELKQRLAERHAQAVPASQPVQQTERERLRNVIAALVSEEQRRWAAR